MLLWTTITSGFNMSAARQHILSTWRAAHLERVDTPTPGRPYSVSDDAASVVDAFDVLLPGMTVLKTLLLLVYEPVIAKWRDAYDANIILEDG